MRVQPTASPLARLDQLKHGHFAKPSVSVKKDVLQTPIITGGKPADATKKASVAAPSNTQSGHGGGTCGVTDPPTPPAFGSNPASAAVEDLTISGCMKAFGQTDSPYDFTQDGIVNVDDLLHMFHNIQWPQQAVLETTQSSVAADPLPGPSDVAPATAASEETETESPGTSVQDPPLSPPAQPDTPMTISGLMNAFGDANSAYDFTGDGAVNVDDLIWYINNWPNPANNAGSSSNGNGVAAAQQPVTGPELSAAMTPASKINDVGRLADLLIDRLTTAGFGEQPPLNIRQLVDKLNLSPADNKQVFNRLSAKYPSGLGMNMVG